VEDELQALREQVRKVDAELQEGIRRRLALALEIGRAKRSRGQPLRDYPIEREVVRRWRSGLEVAGVEGDRAEELARWMVEEAVRVRDALVPAPEVDPVGTDALVVGGAGSMGAWMASFLHAVGHRVAILDPRAEGPSHAGFPVRTDLAEAAAGSDLVVVATPMRVAPTVYRELWRTRTRALVFDVLSVKAPLLPWIRRGVRDGFLVGSIHPLFGPGVRSLTRRNLLLVDCGVPAANDRIEELFSRTSVKVTTIPLHHHDRWMVDALALPHAVSLAFGLALQGRFAETGPQREQVPTSFLRQAEAARVVSHENPELSFDIQTLNPYTATMYARLEKSLRRLRRAVEQEDRGGYRRLMGLVNARFPEEPHPP
jgi:prephenate dehydrogenase/chorismate mutase